MVTNGRRGAARGQEALSRAAKRTLAGTVLDAVGNGFVLPFTIIYLHEIRHISLAVAGSMFSVSALAGVLVVPVVGHLVDRFGPRPLVYATLGLSTIGALTLAGARSFTAAFVGMVVLGMGNGGAWPATQSFAATLVPTEIRNRFFAMSFAALNLGIGLGGLAAAALIQPGHPGTYELLFVIDAATFVVDAIVLLPVRLPPRTPAAHDVDAPKDSYRLLLADRALRRLFATQFTFVLFGYAQIEAGFPAYLRAIGVSPRVVGISFTFNTVTIVLGQLTVQRRSMNVRRTRSLATVAAIWAVSWLVLGVAWWLPHDARAVLGIAYATVFAVGEMFFAPTIPSLVNDIAPERLRGRANAASSLCWTSASVIGPIVAGALIGAGASLEWIGLLIGGCLACCGLALWLERVIPATVNLPSPADEAAVGAMPTTSVSA